MNRVIIADDDRVSSHLLCAVLRRSGYMPEPVFDVDALFAAAARAPVPTAILLDLNMPGGSGADSIRGIRNAPGLAEVPLIVVSGSSDPAASAECLRLGATAYLSKPVEPAMLLGVVQRAIDPERNGGVAQG